MPQAITSLSVIVDKDEYSRFEVENRDITVIIFPKPTSDLSENITIELMKARRTRDKAIYTAVVNVSGSTNSVEHTINLDEVRDVENVSLLRRGLYFVKVSNASKTVTASSDDFNISVVSAERLKSDYSFGLDLFANDIRGVLFQPQVITGVIVKSISKTHPEDFFNLTVDVTSTHKELSWRGGPVVPIRGRGSYVLKAKDGRDYIIVGVGLRASAAFLAASASSSTRKKQCLTRQRCATTYL